jgi:hypothetical protein
MERRATGRVEPIRVPDVYEGDALLDDESGDELRCTGDAVQYGAPDHELTVPYGEVTNVRVDIDRSGAGFTVIGNLFGIASVLLVAAFVRTVPGPGSVFSVVGVASLLAVPLSAYGAAWMRRLEVGERDVLQLDCDDGSRFVFITTDASGAFERIESRITAAERAASERAAGRRRSGAQRQPRVD